MNEPDHPTVASESRPSHGTINQLDPNLVTWKNTPLSERIGRKSDAQEKDPRPFSEIMTERVASLEKIVQDLGARLRQTELDQAREIQDLQQAKQDQAREIVQLRGMMDKISISKSPKVFNPGVKRDQQGQRLLSPPSASRAIAKNDGRTARPGKRPRTEAEAEAEAESDAESDAESEAEAESEAKANALLPDLEPKQGSCAHVP